MEIGSSDTEVVTIEEQPMEAVAAEVEELGTPQTDAIESDNIIIEVDDSPEEKESNTHSAEERKQYAIAQERKKKYEKAKAKAEAAEKRNEELEKRLALLEQAQQDSKIPTLDSCDFDYKEYSEKLEEYYASQATHSNVSDKVEQVAPTVELDSGADFDTMKSIENLNKNVKDFDKSTGALLSKIDSLDVDSAQWTTSMKNLCSQAGVDYAKALYGLSKFSDKGIAALGATTNQFQVVNVLKEYASKVQIKKRKPIKTSPEPSISAGGTADPKQAKIDAAFKAFRDDPTNAEKGRIYQQLRAGLKG